eukprot:NODE_169_length_16247_cov_0.185348.p13 type:complete len:105 gc:universal NODE_169_length_16247_cov_0.185348:5559-5873(+)
MPTVLPYQIEPKQKVSKERVEETLKQYTKCNITVEIMEEIMEKLKANLPSGYKIILHVDSGNFKHLNLSVDTKYLIDKNFDGYSSISWLGKEYVVLTVYWIYFE